MLKEVLFLIICLIWEGAAFEEDRSIWNQMMLKYLYIPYDIPWKVKWSRIENYGGKNDNSNDWKSMESFIVGLGTVQTLKAN